MSRRTPGWLVEATAWSAALVLAAGVAVAASGVIQRDQPRVSAQADTPVLVDTGATAPPAKRAPRPVKGVVSGGRAALTVPPISSLGPPPGIVKDLVPDRYAAPEDRWALLVGITDYRAPTHDTLAGANDVAFVRAYLLGAGWRADHIKVLTNKQANGAAMRAGLAWLVSKSTPGTFASRMKSIKRICSRGYLLNASQGAAGLSIWLPPATILKGARLDASDSSSHSICASPSMRRSFTTGRSSGVL